MREKKFLLMNFFHSADKELSDMLEVGRISSVPSLVRIARMPEDNVSSTGIIPGSLNHGRTFCDASE